MSDSLFMKEVYTRNMDPVTNYVRQASEYISSVKNIPIEDAVEFVKNACKDPVNGVNDPGMWYYERDEEGDRHKKRGTLLQYIRDFINLDYTVAPTFTCYKKPTVNMSIYSEFLTESIALRNKAKHEAAMAKANKDVFLEVAKTLEQKKRKTYNNSLSGSFATKSSIAYNPTGHSTLTSTTRCVSSYGILISEAMISGNKLYDSPDAVINSIVGIVSSTDTTAWTSLINGRGLYVPTVDDIITAVKRSSDLYWTNHKFIDVVLREYLDTLDEPCRSAVMYSGDLYHFRVFNSDLVRKMITDTSTVCTDPVDNLTVDSIREYTPEVINLTHHVCSDYIKGMGVSYETMLKEGVLDTVVSTARSLTKVLESYRDIIQLVLLPDNMPISMSNIKNMMRRVVVVSDTDSTCASYGEWAEWYFDGMKFGQDAIAVTAAVMTFTTQSIAHTLYKFTTNMNVIEKDRGLLEMKNEFYWDVMIPMNSGKHYVARTVISEGSVHEVSELEKKGVHLHASTASAEIQKHSHQLMIDVCDTIGNGNFVDLGKYLTEVAAVEKNIEKGLYEGNIELYTLAKIKDANAYKNGADTPAYKHHIFWDEVMSAKYGPCDIPTYLTVKVPTTLINKTALSEWVDSIEDESFKERLKLWLAKNNKTSLPIIQLPVSRVKEFGIMVEIQCVLDPLRVILDTCNAYYMFLESLGVYKKTGQTLTLQGY